MYIKKNSTLHTDDLSYSLEVSAKLVGVSTEVFTKIFTKYINTFEEKINNLEDFIENNDYKNTANLAHKLKGSSGNMNVTRLYDLFRDIELNSKENKQNSYEEELKEIRKIHGNLKKII